MSREAKPYAIRDRLAGGWDYDEPPIRVDLTIGRKVLGSQSRGVHPLVKYVDETVSGNDPGVFTGEFVSADALHVSLLSAQQMNGIIEGHRVGHQHRNVNARRKEKYFKDAKLSIRSAFGEQESDRPLVIRKSMINTTGRFVTRKANMFEPDVEYIRENDLRSGEDTDLTIGDYRLRGLALLALRKRTETNEHMQEVLKLATYSDGETQAVIRDDLHRVNEALRASGLSTGAMARLTLENLNYEIPFYTHKSRHEARRNDFWTPLTPMGHMTFQPLAVWEGQ